MSKQREFSNKMRIYHRYLGFFLAGIMAVYAVSGVLLIFRNTDFLKKDVLKEEQLTPHLDAAQLGKKIKKNGLEFTHEEGGVFVFPQGTYNGKTGVVKYTTKELPYLLERMARLHIATNEDPLFFLNIFFGVALLFFVISSFWMFLPKTAIFKKGLYFALGGVVLTIILLLV